MKYKIILVLLIVSCLFVIPCAADVPDYSEQVSQIVNNVSLSPQEKLDAQCALFGWDCRLALWDKARTIDYTNMTTVMDYEGLSFAYLPIYQAGLQYEQMYGSDVFRWYDYAEGARAYDLYIQTYIKNLRRCV